MEHHPKKVGVYEEQKMLDNVREALSEYYEDIETDDRALKLRKVTYGNRSYDPNSWRDIKSAVLNQKTISIPAYGEFELIDKDSGRVIDKGKKKIGDIPLMARNNSYIVDGTPYTVPLQLRMKPGAYSREAETGEREVYSNVKGGYSFRTLIDPESQKLTIRVGTTNIPLVPLLKELGMHPNVIAGKIGEELYKSNDVDTKGVLDKAYKSFVGKASDEDDDQKRKVLSETFAKTELNSDVTEKVLGRAHTKVSPDFILDTAEEVIKVTKGDKQGSNRDDIEYKEVYTIMDHLPDILRRKRRSDQVDVFRVKRRMTQRNTIGEILDKPPTAPVLNNYFASSNLSRYSNQINPMAMSSGPFITTLLGDGGISSSESVPSSSTDPQDSHYGFLDVIHTPESFSGGITLNMTTGTRLADKKMYIEVIDVLSGEDTELPNDKLSNYIVAMPHEFKKVGSTWVAKTKKIRALKNGNMSEVEPFEVRYMIKNPGGLFDLSSNTIPFMANTQGNRLLTGSKMIEQALSLVDPDIPLVDAVSDGKSVLDQIGRSYSVRSKEEGKVTNITEDSMVVTDSTGKKHTYDLPHNVPGTQMSYIDSKLRVKIGDSIKNGQLLADTNFTKDGKMVLGKNLNVAYVPWRGKNYEDAVVLTESGANKLRSTHMFQEELIGGDDVIRRNLGGYMAYSPTTIKKESIGNYTGTGVIKPGTKVHRGDVLVAALKRNVPRGTDVFVDLLRKSKAKPYKDGALTWEYDRDGVVTDIVETATGTKVYVKTEEPIRIGDKVVGRYGNKGIVSDIIPDKDTPTMANGEKLDLLIDPLSVVPRINLGQLLETAASKIADRTGTSYLVENFSGIDEREKILDRLKQLKIPEKEDIYDPATGKTLPNIFTGKQYIYKLQHQADLKATGRGIDGAYTHDEQPARGGGGGAQSIGRLSSNVLLAHNARAFMRDAMSIKSGKNSEYWDAIQQGRIPPAPTVPYVWDKFKSYLRGMGINTVQKGSEIELMPLTDRDVEQLSAGVIRNPFRMILGKGVTATPDKDGLFGVDVGGVKGNVYNHIDLGTSMPSPAYKKAITTLLDMKEKDYDAIVQGK